ncbi:DNA adenine methylase [Haloarcula sp. H-GB5]|jgi:DNA adenine methylase
MPRASAPFPWPGNKGRLADWVLDTFPRHDTYIDVFGGSGALLFEKIPAETEIYNDADADLVQFMTTLRDASEELIDRLQMIPYARELHHEWTTDFFEGHRPSDRVERAARYYFIRRAQYGGEAAKKAGFRATVSGRRNPARQWNNSIQRLSNFARRLQGVQIECQDYADLLTDAASGTHSTVVYCDPPYRDSTNRYQLRGTHDSQAKSSSSPAFDFGEFTATIREFARQQNGPRIIVSTDVIPSELDFLHRVSKGSNFSMNAAGGTKETAEHLLTNFDPEATPSHTENASLTAF